MTTTDPTSPAWVATDEHYPDYNVSFDPQNAGNGWTKEVQLTVSEIRLVRRYERLVDKYETMIKTALVRSGHRVQ